jgi:hypothetical protein
MSAIYDQARAMVDNRVDACLEAIQPEMTDMFTAALLADRINQLEVVCDPLDADTQAKKDERDLLLQDPQNQNIAEQFALQYPNSARLMELHFTIIAQQDVSQRLRHRVSELENAMQAGG